MTMKWSLSYNYFIKFRIIKLGAKHDHALSKLYHNQVLNEETTLSYTLKTGK